MNQANPRLGYIFAAMNAVISGFAIFINTYGVKLFPDSTLYTAMKNGVVGLVLLIPVIFVGTQRAEIKRLSLGQRWLLLLLAVIGGSLPYILTFRGFQLSTPTTNALLSHLNFVLVAILAAVFLRERVGWLVWAALGSTAGGRLLGPESACGEPESRRMADTGLDSVLCYRDHHDEIALEGSFTGAGNVCQNVAWLAAPVWVRGRNRALGPDHASDRATMAVCAGDRVDSASLHGDRRAGAQLLFGDGGDGDSGGRPHHYYHAGAYLH